MQYLIILLQGTMFLVIAGVTVFDILYAKGVQQSKQKIGIALPAAIEKLLSLNISFSIVASLILLFFLLISFARF